MCAETIRRDYFLFWHQRNIVAHQLGTNQWMPTSGAHDNCALHSMMTNVIILATMAPTDLATAL